MSGECTDASGLAGKQNGVGFCWIFYFPNPPPPKKKLCA